METKHRSSQSPDGQLQSEILAALDDDPSAPAEHIGVAVTDHVVTLTGVVSRDGERTAAVAAARRVHGVLTVVDDIVVSDAKRVDSTEQHIASAVEGELAHVVVDVPTVQAVVRGRVVTLTGVASDHHQKYALVFAIRDIPGVTWVEDQVVDRERVLHNEERRADHGGGHP